jgi:hypothetical protein
MKNIIIFILFNFSISGNIMAEQNLKLKISTAHYALEVQIYNVSTENVLINKRFAIGTKNSSHSEIAFTFRSSKGQIFDYNAKQKLRPAGEADLCMLSPNMFVGRFYELTDIANDYGLEAGQYQMKATYQNAQLGDKGAFTGILESDWQNIVIK